MSTDKLYYGHFASAVKTMYGVYTKPLFHYTSIHGFLLMIDSIQKRQCNLFPGHLRYQNDSLEFAEGIKHIKKYRGKNRSEVKNCLQSLESNVFASCFSKDGDLLDQWKYYGKNCGLAIEFHFAECEGYWGANKENFDKSRRIIEYPSKIDIPPSILHQGNLTDDSIWELDLPLVIPQETHIMTRGLSDLYPVSVIYDDKEKVKTRKKLLSNIDRYRKELHFVDTDEDRRAVINYLVSTYVPLCKNKHFESEQESRILFLPRKDTTILYREKNGRILPYIKCIVVNKDDTKYPIVSVTVGPGQNQNLVFNAVINKLEDSNNSARFIEDAQMEKVLNDKCKYFSFEELKDQMSSQGLSYYRKKNGEKVLVYRTTNGLFVRRSSIPFRD